MSLSKNTASQQISQAKLFIAIAVIALVMLSTSCSGHLRGDEISARKTFRSCATLAGWDQQADASGLGNGQAYQGPSARHIDQQFGVEECALA